MDINVNQPSRYRTVPVSEEVNVFSTMIPRRLRRISWGAILAGIVISLVTMFALNMLGISVGAATINPATEIDPVEPALGTGSVIWFAASNLIALFLGGLVAGYMSGLRRPEDGLLHGLVTWAVVTLFTVWMLTTSVGGVLNGITNAATQALSAAGSAVSEVAPEVADAFAMQDNTLASIENEIRMMSTDDTAATTGTAGADTEGAAGESVMMNNVDSTTPLTLTQIEIVRGIRSFLTADLTDGDVETRRQELITLIANRTNMTEEEARATVERWETAYVQVREDAEETARTVSQRLADAATVLAGAVFAAMVVGAFAAGAGGYVGTEHVAENLDERDIEDPERQLE